MTSPPLFTNTDGLRAALFDLDGTLITTHIDFGHMRREVAALMARYGLPTEGAQRTDTLAAVRDAAAALSANGGPEAAQRFLADADRLLRAIEHESCGSPEPIAGAADLLSILRGRGIPVAIVTRNCRPVSQALMDAGNLRCDALLTRDDVSETKPNPAHLWTALDRMGVPRCASSDSVMVGDHWMDVQGGKAAGMRTVGLLLGRPARFYAPAEPDLLVDDIAGLLDRVQAQP